MRTVVPPGSVTISTRGMSAPARAAFPHLSRRRTFDFLDARSSAGTFVL